MRLAEPTFAKQIVSFKYFFHIEPEEDCPYFLLYETRHTFSFISIQR